MRPTPTPAPLSRAARLAPYALLGLAALAATWRLFTTPGLPYNVDISGFFPLSPEAYENRFWPLWNERGGMATLQFLPALLTELPLLLAGKTLGWGMDTHVKARILLGFAVAGTSMYALARRYVERHGEGRLPAWAILALPLAPALLYMFNPWSVHRVFHYFLWVGYALAPLVILCLERLLDSPSWRRGLVLALVAAAATTDPHNPPYLAILALPLLALRLAVILRRSRPEALRAVRALGVAAAAYLGIALYWVLPYVSGIRANPALGPTYVMSDQMLAILSRNADLSSVLRLLHNYHPRASFAPEGGGLLTAWTFVGWLVVGAVFLAPLLARRSVAAWAWASVALGTVVLGMGSNGPTGGAYHWLLFQASWGEGLSWLFRDPFRWGGMQALAYAALLSITLARLALLAGSLPQVARRAAHAGLASSAVACAALLVVPGVAAHMSEGSDVFAPVVVPSEYDEANAFLATTPEDSGVVWMPRMLGQTTWGGERGLAYFDATSSARYALGPFRPDTSAYFRFLEDANKDGARLPPLLARAGVDRVLFHNDRNPEADATTAERLERAGLAFEARFGDTPARTVDQSSHAAAGTPAMRIPVNGTTTLEQGFRPAHRAPSQLTLRAVAVGDPGPLEISLVSESNATLATRQASKATNGEVQVSLRGIELSPQRNHTLRLREIPTPQEGRWEVSCYKVDTYARGAFLGAIGVKAPCAGDLAFELQATVAGFASSLVSDAPAPRVRATEGAIASPGGLGMLRALSSLPDASPLATAPVVFTSAHERARATFASQDEGWHWVAGLGEGELETLAPFLPRGSLVAPFASTTSADGKTGWARGTEDFEYYEHGWRLSVRALKQESWDFDLDRGIAYTSATEPLDVSIPGGEAIALARVWMHPKGGLLSVLALTPDGTREVGVVDGRAASSGFRWVEVGRVPEGATALRLVGDGAFFGVNLIAVPSLPAFAGAVAARDARFDGMPVTLLAQAETVPALAARVSALPDVGRFVDLNGTTEVAVHVPASGDYALWVRAPSGSAAPNATLDGRPLALACGAGCDGPVSWLAAPAVPLDAGVHALRLAPGPGATRAQIDVLALTSEPDGLLGGPAPAAADWTRIDATTYRVDVQTVGPVVLTLAQPSDAGWIARLPDGRVVRSHPVDGVANGFRLDLDAPGTVEIVYEPQAWAETGAVASLAVLLAVAAAFALPPMAHRVRRLRSVPAEET